jgi:hypothetical protein
MYLVGMSDADPVSSREALGAEQQLDPWRHIYRA